MKRPLDEDLSALSPKKRQLLELLAKNGRAPTAAAPSAPAAPSGPAPLSFGQQRLWFQEQLMPGSALYNEYLQMRIEGQLDSDALQRALEAVAARHDVLRSVFRVEQGEPVQVVLPVAPLEIPRIDLSSLAPNARSVALAQVEAEEAARPFDLTKGPLMRGRLVKLAQDEHALLVSVHHIVCDGWSLGIFMREVATFYRAFATGKTPRLPPLTSQYADYARAQRRRLGGPIAEEQLAYWKKELEGAPPLLQLPTVRKRPPVRTMSGATHFFSLGRTTVERIKALARAEEATPFMVLMAAYQALLHRYTGQTDVCVGTPLANRSSVEAEGLIGFFVNFAVLRSTFSEGQTFHDLLRRVREAALGAYAHQDLPFDQVVDALKPARDASYSPLFQVVLNLHNTPIQPMELDGLRISPVARDNGTSKFDIVLAFTEKGDELAGYFEYNTDLFDADMMGRMAGHFQNLLETVLGDPRAVLSRIDLLTEAERHHLVVERNVTRSFASERLIHEIFEQQAAKAPDAAAVSFVGETLSYAELNRRANRLARHLRARGVGPNVLTGICLERSLEMIVAILAVLKAGGAYVPLDPSDPADRRAFMIADSAVPVVITRGALVAPPAGSSCTLVRLDADAAEIERADDTNLESPRSPGQLAYVIYTSGSTGKPKGVLVTHANVARLFTSTEEWFHFGPKDVWTLFHSFAFDFSVWEIWGALLYGGKLVVVPYLVSRSPDTFYELLRSEKVTVLNQTPSAFRQIVHHEERHGAARDLALRYIVFGGEALELGGLRPWFANHADDAPRLVNMYGITETTVHVTYRPIASADVDAASGSVIGAPIPDLECYVLDAHLQPVPLGVAGELYVGGAGVAKGYLGRPELTAQRFIANPFRDGGVLYKSGDVVRPLPGRAGSAGDMEYIGRSDFQVKIRGFRIELEEVQATVARQAGVRECVVIVREDDPGDKQLVAYIVPSQEQPATARSLRESLSAIIPSHMVPASFVFLEAFKLTNNGKLDRAALPAPSRATVPEHARTNIAPASATEDAIAAIWRSVLKREVVGPEDNFFDIGGNSLNIATIQARLVEELKLPVSIVDLFEHSTIRELTTHLQGVTEPVEESPRAEAAPERAASQVDRRNLRRQGRDESDDGDQ